MKTKIISFITVVAILMVIGCKNNKKANYVDMSAANACGVGCDTLVFLPNNPIDVKILNQQCANTFAWQSFIALTWPSSPVEAGQPDRSKSVKDWGKPGDLTPMALGTYKSAESIFTDQAPTRWGNNLNQLMDTTSTDNKSARSFADFSKFDDDAEVVDQLFQASGGTSWLTDQNGNLIWYEIKTNYTEFDYIVSNKLYDSIAQQQFAKETGIWLPNGSIEIKAAWRVIPEVDYNKLKSRYKIITALVPQNVVVKSRKDVTMTDFKETKLGLVGLHIIKKTPTMPQFHWATFEHVDLAPETNVKESDVDWLLYNPEKYNDPVNQTPRVGKDPITKPVQVIKEHEAGVGLDAKVLNTFVKEKIAKLNPDSVFQYYNLVDSQWPSSAVADSDNNIYTPLQNGGQTPVIMTNVTMETYIQKISCLDCHINAGVSSRTPEGKEYASDYSFMFGMAKKQKPSIIEVPKKEKAMK
ncbi:hypothetical protein [Kordia sp.]|uniref:hypothetical protein n=1 Tax=Kordia sp. TaxID=1965332 RepID=UPI0025C6767A|nr:hypothetical protein [Kordia sp.]MCH2192739.1 hypothetical protein [Kordia sp.]MCH2232498.1 hypothetical protein [Crocinitomicaceae bacterium]